jgi:hypothetical protein
LFGGFRAEEQAVQGLVEVLDKDYLVFAERLAEGNGHTALSLVRVTTSGLELVDRVLSPLRVELLHDIGLDWTMRIPAYLVPIGYQRFAYLATRTGIEIYDYSKGKLVLLSSSPLSAQDPMTYDVAWANGRLWTCAGALQSYTVSEEGKVSAGESVPVTSGCKDLTASEDGQQLFVSNSTGIYAVQLLTKPIVTHQTTGLSLFTGLSSSGGYVAGIRSVAAGLAGSVGVFRANDLSPLATLPVTARSEATSVALHEGELFVQISRTSNGRSSAWLERYSIANDVLSLEGSQLIRDTSGPNIAAYGNPVPISLRENLIAVLPWRDVLRITPGEMRPITGAQHGAIEQLVPVSPTTLDGFGPDSVYRFDITDPRRPTVLDGGRTLGPYVNELRLISGPQPSRLVNVPVFSSPVRQDRSTTELSHFASRVSRLPELSNTLTLDGGPAVLDSSNGQLFQVNSPTATTYRVRRFGALPRGEGAGSGQLVSDLDRTFSLTPPSAWPTRANWRFTASADGGLVALVELRNGLGAGENTDWLSIVTLTEHGATPIAGVQLNYPSLVEIAGERILVATSGAIEVYGLVGSTLKLLVQRTELTQQEVRRILRWDGKQAVLTTQTWRDENLVHGVLVLSGDDLSELAYYETEDEVLSVTVAGDHYAFAWKSGIELASPACP